MTSFNTLCAIAISLLPSFSEVINSVTSPIDIALISAIFLLPIFTANETGFKRAPLQVLQGFCRM